MEMHISDRTHKFQSKTRLDAKANSELYKSKRVCSAVCLEIKCRVSGMGGFLSVQQTFLNRANQQDCGPGMFTMFKPIKSHEVKLRVVNESA